MFHAACVAVSDQFHMAQKRKERASIEEEGSRMRRTRRRERNKVEPRNGMASISYTAEWCAWRDRGWGTGSSTWNGEMPWREKGSAGSLERTLSEAVRNHERDSSATDAQSFMPDVGVSAEIDVRRGEAAQRRMVWGMLSWCKRILSVLTEMWMTERERVV